MARIIKKNVSWSEERTCPKCGRRAPYHGGLPWKGDDVTCPIESDDGSYEREFDGGCLYETYVCPECGTKWLIMRGAHDGYYADDHFRRIEAFDEIYDARWGNEWLSCDGKKAYRDLYCLKDGIEWYGFEVFLLAAPDKAWDEN